MASDTPAIPPRLARDAVRVAFTWQGLRQWERLDNGDIVAVRIPGEPEPWFTSVMGQGGREFGVVAYRGEAGIAQFRAALAGGDDARHLRADMVSMSIDWPSSVPAELRRIAAAGGCSARLVPIFLVKPLGQSVREARKAELRTVIAILRALQLARERGLLVPVALQPEGPARLLVLTVRGDEHAFDVAAKYGTFAAGAAERDPQAADADVLAALRELPRLDSEWLVAWRPFPVRVTGDDTEVMALLIAERESRRPLAITVMTTGEVAEAVDRFCHACLGANLARSRGVPRQMTCTSRELHDALAPGLGELGSACAFAEDDPVLEDLWADLDRHLAGGAAPAAPPPGGVPAWREAESRMVERMLRRREARSLGRDAAQCEYFGEVLRHGLPEDRTPSYLEWFLTYFRPVAGGPSLAEKLLAEDLPADERALLQARVAGRLGIWRIVAIADATIALEDVVTGAEASVLDRSMALTARPGIVVPGSVCGIEGEHFFTALGPPLNALQVDSALEFLEEEGLVLTGAGVAAAPHLFGRLWAWREDVAAVQEATGGPLLQNTDGHPVRVQQATFAVADAGVLRAQLDARADVHRDDDEGDDAWVWFREQGEQRTLLARLQLLGGELLVQVNSDERLAAVRAWLEGSAGVAFVRTRVQEFEDVPRDDRLRASKGVPSAETVEAVRAHVREGCMRWLDEPIPALGGKTPREAARTEKGKAKVARLIRTWPDPGGIEGVAVPRKEMLRELGLAEE